MANQLRKAVEEPYSHLPLELNSVSEQCHDLSLGFFVHSLTFLQFPAILRGQLGINTFKGVLRKGAFEGEEHDFARNGV